MTTAVPRPLLHLPFLPALALAALLAASPASAQSAEVDAEADTLARRVSVPDPQARQIALDEVVMRGKPDLVAPLIQTLRFVRDDGGLNTALELITGARPGATWHDWMLWQQAHPEIEPYAGFDAFKADAMAVLDPSFRIFLQPGVRHEIRLEEIAWGGVIKDGIPALVNPTLVSPAEAGYLTPEEQVFGVEINGDVRAYPLRIMDWHEMFNDVIGGLPVALAYCTLCGSGILFETLVEGRPEPFVFGSSGFLYRSNKLMYDQETHSLWNQFTGRPVVGPLTGSGLTLQVRPLAITTWADWLERHPDTKVLSLETGHLRDYSPGRPYGDYFASPALMFPAQVRDDRLAPKEQVFALRGSGQEKAWPLDVFNDGAVINDRVGLLDLVLIGRAETRTVRAYRSEGRRFERYLEADDHLEADGRVWRITEEALLGPDGERLSRLPGHIAYWFAWSGFIDN